jgi:hypothetical protein
MSHMWVDLTFLLSGRFIINGFKVMRLLTASALSMMKMDIAPISAIACNVALVKAFKASCDVGPRKTCAAAAHVRGRDQR